MASDIRAGGAFVELMLKDKKFLAGLSAARQKMIGFAKGAAMLGGAVVAAGAAASAVAFKNFLTLGDELQKLSDRTGLTVENLSELKHAARQSDVEFKSLGMALRQMQQKGLDPAKFDEFATSLASIADPTERARLSMELFGARAGTAILPMLKDLPALCKEARDLGLVMGGESAQSAVRLGDMLSNLWETLKMGTVAFGSAFAPLAEVVLPAIQSFATIGLKRIQEFATGMAATMSGIGNFFVNIWSTAFDWWRTAQETILNYGVFAWENFGSILKTLLISAELSVVRFGNQTVHFFGTVIPGYLGWFGDNWRNIFTDIANCTETVATNIWNNIKNLWDAIKGVFKGKGFQFEWTDLETGLKKAITELPRIAAREMGPLEKSLQDELNAVADGLASSWDTHQGNMPALAKAFLPDPDEFQNILATAKDQAKQGSEAVMSASSAAGTSKGRDPVSTFSAVAAAAIGQGGGGVQDKIHDEIKKGNEKREREALKLITAIRTAGGLA